MSMIKQQERQEILLRIEKEILIFINDYCKEEGFIRNKLIERFIREGLINELSKKKRYQKLEEFYENERKKKKESLKLSNERRTNRNDNL
jgi:hypothetical protein